MRMFRTFLQPLRESMPILFPYAEALPEHRKVEDQLVESLEPDGSVRDAASAQLSTLRQRKKSAASRIIERVQAYTTGRTRELLSDPIYTVRDGRYVIPLKAENRGKIRGIVHDTSASGQTIYLEPADVLDLGNALREVEAAERAEEQRILTALSGKVGGVAPDILGGLEAAAQLDMHFAKARLGYEMKGSLPNRVEGSAFIQVQGGRHPLLDPEIAVPLDLAVGKGSSVLITGPNTGGKTVSIKTVGLFVLMAQTGMLPPAIDIRLAPFTQVWADIGDEQSLQQSLSTFSGHIRNISAALTGLKDGALVLLDEIGAGTDPAEGAALATAILRDMSSRGAAILASTHYGELKAFAYNTPGFVNAAMEFDPKSLRPTYRLIMGAPGASHALRIAERYGIPPEIVEHAREGLGDQAQDVARMMERLEQAQRQARIAQGEADRRTQELRRAEQRAARKLEEADEIRKTANSKANEVIEAALREIRLEASRLFDELKKAPVDPRVQERVRKGLRELDEVGRDFAAEFVPKPKRAAGAAVGALRKGATVRLEGYTQVGTLLEDPRDDSVQVQLGPLKMTVPVHRLHPVDKPSGTLVKPRANIRLQKAISATTEIMLINKRAEDATRELERFVDDAMLAGIPSVRIVHGKGEGILRKVTHEFLKGHPGVANFRDGEPAEGGAGVTIATFQ
jgi:DNA mismatch repair protein MutS2